MMIKKMFRTASGTLLAISIILTSTVFFSVTLTGCGKEENAIAESVELVDPVGSAETYAVAERRDLKTVTLLNGKVVPKVYEYNFSSNQNFSSYINLPGMPVSKNDGLVKASTEKLDDQTKAVKEEMNDFMDLYNADMEELNESLAAAKAKEAHWQEIVERLDGMTQAELDAYNESFYKAVEAKQPVTADWSENGIRKEYIGAVSSRERIEQNIKERTENYELDLAHYKTRLKRIDKKREDVVVSTKVDGKVVAIHYTQENNEWISKETPVAAVGDFNSLEVKTDYVVSSDVKKALEVYGFANGKRYEVEFVEPEPNETISSMADARSTFKVSDPEGNIKAGDYLVVVIVSKESKDAIAIPNEALNKDDEGSFVYVLEGDSKIKRQVKTGIKSGMYTEILSGLNEGEKVSADIKAENKNKTKVLEKGKVATGFSANGYLFYSNVQIIENPVEYGTVYVKEINVKQNERVEKGQIVATVWVTPDDIAIRRKERTLLRANEDLNELIKDGEENNKRAIKNKRDYISELTKQINEMKADAATTTITAPFDGIITDVGRFEEGDILLADYGIATISSEDNCYVVFEDKAGQLTCGNVANISYKDDSGKEYTAEGEVVTVSKWALSERLSSDYTLVRVSSEDLERMASANRGYDGFWRRMSFSINAEVRTVSDVVLVPKSAVTTVDSVTYVTVEENGKKVQKSFIAGGSDSTNYWVIEGLSEGTKICLE